MSGLPSGHIYRPPADALSILYQDDHVLLVDKPAGLLSVPGKTDDLADCLEARVKAAFRHALLVHRLDMDTSGIMVFALSRIAQRDLNKQFETRAVKKTYIARIWGRPQQDAGVIDLPMRADWPNRPLQMIAEDGKPAVTHWQVVAEEGPLTRVRLTPKTGRSHQLRLHMQALGHPIAGDRFYAADAALAAADRLELHAETLAFRDPLGAWVNGAAPCPF
ncbi:pseudouridine synthase [Halovulum sp. GXIMD14793]